MSKNNYPPEAQKKIEALLAENELMRKLATASGFYEYFFSQLPHHETLTDCFNMVNDKYFDFFGEYRYSSYNSFATHKNRKK